MQVIPTSWAQQNTKFLGGLVASLKRKNTITLVLELSYTLTYLITYLLSSFLTYLLRHRAEYYLRS